jgi:predicted small secreted protein
MMSLTACGTLGGAMQGAGEDLNRAGGYVRSVGK